MGKAAIVNPYLDTLGGGERYTISFAKVLSEEGYRVDVEWKDPLIKNKLEKRFGINLNGINFITDVKKGDGYDICFWVSDGSIPLLRARKNLIHFQIPFKNVDGKSLLNKMKFFRINKVICNSSFTKEIIDKEYGINSMVLYPPIDTKSIVKKRKENVILYVGRFSKLLQNKQQDELIKAFRKLNINDWKLVLAGGNEIGKSQYISELINLSKGINVEIIESPSFNILKELYGKAKIFWSASGYNVDQNMSPEKLEHFGMSVIESMAGGAVPIIFSGGGHKEIITDGVNGYLWRGTDELIEKTKYLINNKIIWKNLSLNAIKFSQNFSYVEFGKYIKKIL